ncbi:uncharacterized protein LY79DRAFT_550334 [Colletotrichum navitas]|uniref:Uncharacterized protein n=1 Tax=Colletotrichum navitas TaxID=681940 RepID=A0AAD8Q1H3_9PEZI|nr:uncharacterized protein LY79DRAFT_550334 [Colletotrichum navitas]KAK1593933.1 hypothetical protein LY79DRAFT_550334 [Colletotrichum navitas]
MPLKKKRRKKKASCGRMAFCVSGVNMGFIGLLILGLTYESVFPWHCGLFFALTRLAQPFSRHARGKKASSSSSIDSSAAAMRDDGDPGLSRRDIGIYVTMFGRYVQVRAMKHDRPCNLSPSSLSNSPVARPSLHLSLLFFSFLRHRISQCPPSRLSTTPTPCRAEAFHPKPAGVACEATE